MTLRGLHSIRVCGGSLAGALVLGLLAARPAPGQGVDAEGDVRVIEIVDPGSGQRYRQAVYDLTKREIRAVQRALRKAGYLGVGWTGRLDHGTVSALSRLQEDRGLYLCGCVSYETVVALGLTPAVEVTTVAVGGSGAGSYGIERGYCYGCQYGLYYPVPVPIWVPVDADDGAGGEPGREGGVDPHGSVPEAPPSAGPAGPVTPGIRPPHPGRVGPPPPAGLAPEPRPAAPATRVVP